MKLVLFLYSVSFFYTTVLQAESAYFYNRPSIESIQARKPTLPMPKHWGKHKNGMMVAVAELLAIYPEAELYFLARDSEYFYDLAKALTIGNADAKRIHLLNVSRKNMRQPLLVDYLKQEGLTNKSLQGRKAILVDTGWAGSIPKVMKDAVEPGVELIPHFLHSKNPNIASSRVYLENVVSGKVNVKNPGEHHSELLELEHIPHYSDISTGFGFDIGGISAFSMTTPSDVSHVIEMMADLRYFAEKPEIENRFDELRQVMKELYAAAIGKNTLSERDLISNMQMLKENGASHFLEDLKEQGRLLGINHMERFVDDVKILLHAQPSVTPEVRNKQQSDFAPLPRIQSELTARMDPEQWFSVLKKYLVDVKTMDDFFKLIDARPKNSPFWVHTSTRGMYYYDQFITENLPFIAKLNPTEIQTRRLGSYVVRPYGLKQLRFEIEHLQAIQSGNAHLKCLYAFKKLFNAY